MDKKVIPKPTPFSSDLQNKIDILRAFMRPINLGNLSFSSPLLLAPMSSITTPPYRQLMQDLGVGGTISELISCHGIKHGNDRTKNMLQVWKTEKNLGLQLFGEDAPTLQYAAQVAQEYGPDFIDLNMGCPVKKVVTRGSGAALLKDPQKLGPFFRQIKKDLQIPLTIKIRIGWDEDMINAHEVIHVAKEEGIEFVSIHGRTRAQKYQGFANWTYLEELPEKSFLPLVGNGDLFTSEGVKERLQKTSMQALMIGRGALRNPFIFLESYDEKNEFYFTANCYYEVIQRLYYYLESHMKNPRHLLIQLRKFLLWFSSGFSKSVRFREVIFATQDPKDLLKQAEDYFLSLGRMQKTLKNHHQFMQGGHG